MQSMYVKYNALKLHSNTVQQSNLTQKIIVVVVVVVIVVVVVVAVMFLVGVAICV